MDHVLVCNALEPTKDAALSPHRVREAGVWEDSGGSTAFGNSHLVLFFLMGVQLCGPVISVCIFPMTKEVVHFPLCA